MTSILPRFHLFISLGAIVFLTFGGCSASIPAEDETELINEQTIPESASSESHTPASRSQKRHTNRLARETSPYLLLHAHNPVNWYPWGEEALSKANVEKKIIFLSVGYSSCFWCHVMERESFMDMEIADFLNEHFVCIKVDREERPDVDSIYMTAIQLLTRHGGWPMSVFLTPNARPFFGGTYFPARDDDRTGRPGFLTVIRKTQELWKDQRKMVEESAQRLSDAVKTELERRVNPQPIKLAPDILDNVRRQLADVYDPDYGGFGYSAQNPHRPKFPEPPKLLFQIERARRIGNDQTLQMLENTLDRMAEGGIRDHLGGGFHRYSTDRFWHIPHFEKMLYDNGQLATVYAEAYALTNRAVYRQVVDELLDFVTREMTSPDGGFYAALDAETDTEEGKYYRWEIEEIQEVLSDDQWQRMAPVYGFDSAPNFENEFYVPLLTERLREISPDILKQREVELNPLRAKLLEVRSRRERPLLDTKIITSWNGLMIRGFADAGRIFKNDAYIKTATRAADFVLAELQTENGRLLRNYAGGKANLNAYLDDYAYLIDGLIALHRATGKNNWLETADRLTSTQLELFWDKNHGGFFFTTDDHESLLARAKDPVDGVRPAGISVSADNLVYLARTLDRPEYLKRAEATIQSSADFLKQSPIAVTRMATAIMAWLDAGAEE